MYTSPLLSRHWEYFLPVLVYFPLSYKLNYDIKDFLLVGYSLLIFFLKATLFDSWELFIPTPRSWDIHLNLRPSNLGGHQHHLEGFLKHIFLGTASRVSNSVGQGRGPRTCIVYDFQKMLIFLVWESYFANHCILIFWEA